MTTFARGNFTQLWLKLTSDEPLGVLDTDYLEDYFGNDGFITLYHVGTETNYQVSMLPVPGDTPGVDNDVFSGVYSPLSTLPNGAYELRFRCRDPYGNYTISNSVLNPFGDERVLALMLTLVTSENPYVVGIGVVARLGFQINVGRNLAIGVNARRRGIEL
jgi:hypothetical protein